MLYVFVVSFNAPNALVYIGQLGVYFNPNEYSYTRFEWKKMTQDLQQKLSPDIRETRFYIAFDLLK
jgi:hypothetical protein